MIFSVLPHAVIARSKDNGTWGWYVLAGRAGFASPPKRTYQRLPATPSVLATILLNEHARCMDMLAPGVVSCHIHVRHIAAYEATPVPMRGGDAGPYKAKWSRESILRER